MAGSRDTRGRARRPWLLLGAAAGVLVASLLALTGLGRAPEAPRPDGGGAGATSTPAPVAPSPPAASGPGRSQLRGVWVHLFDDTLKSPASIDRMLDRVAAAGANTVIAEVVRRQDAYYRSDVLPRTTDPAVPAGFDPLGHLAAGARERGLRLQAWVPVLPAYDAVYDGLPHPEGWVFSEHGPAAPPEQRWVTRRVDGSWDDHLDPGHPAVRRHVVAVVTEIARRYDIDSVHLDYLRYTDPTTGYNPAALRRFRAQTGATGTPAPDDPAFSAWRREQTRSLLVAVRESVTAAAPEVAVSAAVIAQRQGPGGGHPFTATPAYAEYFQDWAGWVRDGLVDAVMPMAYFADREHGGWFARWIGFARRLARASQAVVAPGVAGYLNPPAAGRAQLRAAMRGTDGAVVYSYQQSAAGTGTSLLDDLGRGLWRLPAAAPRGG